MRKLVLTPKSAGILGFIMGCAACAISALAASALIVGAGVFDISAVHPHGRLATWAMHTTMIHAEQRRAASITAPARFTVAQVAQGARVYDVDCAMCHGGPGVARAPWTAGLTPTPPYLVGAARHWTGAELYSIVADGVKMTAMPAWRVARSSQDIWAIVAFLQALPGLSPQDYARLKAAPLPQTRPLGGSR
jgi:mono/diheme cytochrome c family protein